MQALQMVVTSLCLWVFIEMMFPNLWDNSIQPLLLIAAGIGTVVHLALFAKRGQIVKGLLTLILGTGLCVGIMYLGLAHFLNLRNHPNLFGDMFHGGQ